jgi:BASS family bile acid:Na+ symporter
MDVLRKATTAAMLGFVISSMLAMGAGLTVEQIVAALRNRRLILSALLSNFVLMPLGALVLARALSLDEPLGIGLLLLGCAAGAPFLPKLAELARGNLPFAVGIMVMLMVVTVGYLPIVLPVLLPNVTVSPSKIAQSLLLLMLLPLGVGLIVKSYRNRLAVRIKPSLDWFSNISLILLILLMSLTNFDKVLQVFGRRGILAGLVFIALGCSIGWLFGGPGDDQRRVLALGTGQRNIAAALVVGSSFSDPEVTIMVVVVALIGLVTLMPLARALGRRAPRPPSNEIRPAARRDEEMRTRSEASPSGRSCS